MYPGAISNVATLERTVERVLSLGADACTLVMGRGIGSAANLRNMIDAGLRFVIPTRKSTRSVKELLSQLVKVKDDPDSDRIHNGVVYAVIEADVAIVPKYERNDDEEGDDAELEMVLVDDDRFHEVSEEQRMKAIAYFDAGKAAGDRRRTQLALADIEKRLRSIDMWTAVREQKKIAGPYRKYIECRVDDDRPVIERKRNALSFAVDREDMLVILSYGVVDWETMMSCYDCRAFVEQAFYALKN